MILVVSCGAEVLLVGAFTNSLVSRMMNPLNRTTKELLTDEIGAMQTVPGPAKVSVLVIQCDLYQGRTVTLFLFLRGVEMSSKPVFQLHLRRTNA